MDTWILGLLGLQVVVGGLMIFVLLKRLRELDHKINESVEHVEDTNRRINRLVRSAQPAATTLDEPLGALQDANGLEALRLIKKLADSKEQLVQHADNLLNTLTNEPSAAVRLFMIDALANAKEPGVLEQAVIAGLDDRDLAIKAHCAMLAGRHRMDRQCIRDSLHRLGNRAADSNFAVKRFSSWALSQFRRSRSGENELPQLEVFGYVLIKSTSSSPEAIQALIDDLHWERYPRGAGVLDASMIQGQIDVLLKVAARNRHYFDDFVMNELQQLEWIDEPTQTLQIITPPHLLHWIKWDLQQPPQLDASTWVMIEAPAAKSALVLLAIRDLAEFGDVQEGAAIFGPAELMVNIGANSQARVDEVVKKLAKIPYVKRTVSFRVFEPTITHHIRYCGQEIVGLYKEIKATR